MLKHFIVVTLRNFRRNKFYTFLNIFGLAIGIATAILSLLYVGHELSYDRFHEKSGRIYRIAVDALSGNTVIKQTFNPAPMPAALYTEYPEIEAVCRIAGSGGATKIQAGDRVFQESNFLLADTTFFTIFSAEFVAGQPDPSILGPNKVVLTEKMAYKYFGDANPIGQLLVADDEYTFQVSAVIKEFPDNSHFHFDMLLSLLSFDGFYNSTQWFNNNFRIYILLHPDQDYKALEAKFPDFVNKYHYEGHYTEKSDESNKWELYLQPLTDIHLSSHLSGEFEANGNAAYVYIFAVTAIFILLLACINFINLATARSATRAKEISIRKVVGSGKKDLIRQFLSESLVISTISMIVGLILAELALLYLPELLGINIPLSNELRLLLIPVLIGLTLLIGFLSGTYPALILSGFKPIAILNNQRFKGSKGIWSRNVLVVFQFTTSIVLIIGTLVISKQLDFIQNERLGFDKEHVVVIKNANLIQNQLAAFKNELLKLTTVQCVSASHRLPGIRFNNIGFGAEGQEGGFTLNLCMSDADFQKVFKFKMTQGRYFSKEYSTDTTGIVLNEAAVNLLGWENPIGRKIHNWANDKVWFDVIGVVEDLHYESMHTKIRPMALLHLNSPFHWTPRYISVRINSQNIPEILRQMRSIWDRFSPQLPFEYSFFDQDYDNLYINEMHTKSLFILFAMLAIFIACLGLFGLAAFLIEYRFREIGIRKVLGASVTGLVYLLSSQFTRWVLIANLVAWPVAWYVMNRWLENFAYRIEIGWWIYLLAGVIALLIALITVSAQAIKAALLNPADSLRYE